MATISRSTGCRTAERISPAASATCPSVICTYFKENFYGPRQTWRHLARQAQEGSEGRQGLLRSSQEHDSYRQAGGGEGKPICLPRPQATQAHIPCLVDPALKRGGSALWLELQPLHRRAGQSRRDGRPEGFVRSCSPRTGCIPGDRGKGQSRVARVTSASNANRGAMRGSCPRMTG